MENNKIENLAYQINSFITTVLRAAEREGKLDHFNIEISNHNGNLQMDYVVKDRKKVY